MKKSFLSLVFVFAFVVCFSVSGFAWFTMDVPSLGRGDDVVTPEDEESPDASSSSGEPRITAVRVPKIVINGNGKSIISKSGSSYSGGATGAPNVVIVDEETPL